jgi:hypothetical protein
MDPRPPQRPRRISKRFAAALILLNIIGACYFLAPHTVGDQARQQLCKRLQAHYPNLDVRIARGEIARDGGLVLDGIEFHTRPQRLRESSRPILKIARLTVLGDVQLERVLDATAPFRLRKIIAEGVVAELWQDADGTWSPELLWPPLVMDDDCPAIEIREGRVRLHAAGDSSARPLELDHINAALDLVHDAELENSTGWCPPEDHPVHGAPAAACKPSDFLSAIQAQFSLSAAGAFVQSVTVSGEINKGRILLSGESAALRIDPMLVSRLPWITPERLEQLAGLSLLADVHWTSDIDVLALAEPVSSDSASSPQLRDSAVAIDQPASRQPLTFGADWVIRDGRFDHASLPQPLEKLAGRISMHLGGIDIQWAQCQFGDASMRLAATIDGWSDAADMRGRLTASGLLVNERLARKLPATASDAWDEIRPSGPVDLDLQLARCSGEWITQGAAELRGVDVQLSDFPYPVSQLIGKLHFNDTAVWSDGLSGRVSGQRLSVAFEQNLWGNTGPTWLQLAADGPVPIDSPLVSALTPLGEPSSPLEDFVRSLSPSGSVHLIAARFDRDAQGQERKSLDLRIGGGSLRYKEFPYPLYDIRGQILVHDDWVRLVGFQASNSDNARITCEGRFLGMPDDAPHPTDGDWQVALQFRCRDLPLDETLRAALSESSRQNWDNLSPTGVLDQVDIALHHADRWPEPRLLITAHQHPRPVIDNRTVSLRAADVPYRIDVVEGAVRFDGTDVIIDSLDGRHDSTRIAADGRCHRTSSGQWRLDLNIHSGSRLHPDAELIGSLPAEVRGAFQRLQLRGPLSARGTVGIMLPDDLHIDPVIDWAVVLQLEGNRIGDVGPVHDIRGEITMQGMRDSASVIADGVVSIDSMHIDSQQVTSIHGPYGIRDDRLLLGESLVLSDSSDESSSIPVYGVSRTQPIQGKLFGGKCTLSGDVVLSDGEFDVVLSLTDADVATMVVELGQADSSVRGKAQGQVRLEGVVGAGHLLKGAGTAKVSQANLYQLPLLISVFNLLRVKPSEAVAFTDGEARFSVYGDNVTFNELKLWGDLIALHGSGTMNRSQEVNLSFNTRVSPQNIWSQVVRPFGENQYTLWTLNVKGPLSNPHIERRAMESVGGTLERLIPGMGELQRPAERQTPIGRLRERLNR